MPSPWWRGGKEEGAFRLECPPPAGDETFFCGEARLGPPPEKFPRGSSVNIEQGFAHILRISVCFINDPAHQSTDLYCDCLLEICFLHLLRTVLKFLLP